MIEELKELVAVLNSLPQLALWVAIGFWAYKVLIIGSIYGLIRFVVTKALEAWKHRREFITRELLIHKEVPSARFDQSTFHEVIRELKRLEYARRPKGSDTDFFWVHDLQALREAVDLWVEKNKPNK